MTGVALQFHFGQYIQFLGFGVDTLGRVLSISVIGTLLIRMRIGRWIDRFGCRRTWLVGCVIVAAAISSIQFVERLWLITVLRTLWAMSMAAVMTTVPVFAVRMAPPARRAEAIGTMGLAGFVGIMIGPTLGDWIFSGRTDLITPYRLFFWASAGCGLLSGVVIFLTKVESANLAGESETTTLPQGRGPQTHSTSQLKLIMQHWPGMVLLVGLVFSMVFCFQSMFIERLAEARGFKDVKVFFLVYAPTAIALRLLFRHVPRRVGRTRTVLFGLLMFTLGLFCLAGVQAQWQLALPGLLMGTGHCFIFPSMIDLAAERFPFVSRGTGTALILGSGDLGMLIGFATLAELIDTYGYRTAIMCLAGLVLVSAVAFALARRDALLHRECRKAPRRQLPRTE
jgi:MFS family permease